MIYPDSVAEFIKRHQLISEGDRVLVAVSGGPDSVALLHILHELRDEFRLHLEVAHLQHGIRGEEAKEDARFVARLADQLKVSFHLREVDLPTMKLAAGKGNLEALARTERYRFFSEVARDRNIRKVATAHTQDDQAETVLMWFLRGAGVNGMGGMSALHPLNGASAGSDALTVIRPLLEMSKAEVLQYLAERKLPFRLDRSNLDRTLLRNWLRLDLLPVIRHRVDMRLAERLSHQAELCRDDNAVLNDLAQRRYERMVTARALSRQALLTEPRALQRRILRIWIEQNQGHLRSLEFIHIENILRLILEETPQGRVSMPGGWEFVREYDVLKVLKRFRSAHRICYNYALKIGGVLTIPEAGLELCSRRVSAAASRLPEGLMDAVFDAARLSEPLAVRNFRPGDRFQPLGMSGHKKVKDLFIEKRVPVALRARWPLVTSSDEVVWVPGYGRSCVGLLSKETASVLHVKARSIPQ